MAITQRTWRISNPLIISVLVAIIILSSGCVSSYPIDVENVEVSITATSDVNCFEVDNHEQNQEKILTESEISTPTQVVKNNLGMVPPIEEINDNLFEPILGFPI